MNACAALIKCLDAVTSDKVLQSEVCCTACSVRWRTMLEENGVDAKMLCCEVGSIACEDCSALPLITRLNDQA